MTQPEWELKVVAMGERYAFGVDEPWKAWVAYAKAGWDTITKPGPWPNKWLPRLFFFLQKKIGCGCQDRFGMPFWLVGEFTTNFRTYFSGDWDVHWGLRAFDPWPF